MSEREPDELVLRISSTDYDLSFISSPQSSAFTEAVYERIRGLLGARHPSHKYVGRRGNDDELSLYPEADFWVVCYWERGRGRRPAFFVSFRDAVKFFLIQTTGSDSLEWGDLPNVWAR